MRVDRLLSTGTLMCLTNLGWTKAVPLGKRFQGTNKRWYQEVFMPETKQTATVAIQNLQQREYVGE